MNILVTGGAGYIGSHTSVVLLKAGHRVIIADNLSNSRADTVEKIRQIALSENSSLQGGDLVFYRADMTDSGDVERIFAEHEVEGVIHFAGFKSVGESTQKPISYYYNNLLSTIVLSRVSVAHGVARFVFSSSATVYGEGRAPFTETMDLLPATNPYGATKAMSERILSDVASANSGFSACLLRYFNPVGAHESGLIGESPRGIPNNLMPYMTQVARGKLKMLNVFGDDYPTSDGTGVRDYIHVMDLAEGHVAAIERLSSGVSVYNLGTGRGTSVLELIKAFERVNGVKIPCKITGRRPGDIAVCYADASKAQKELGWVARRGIDDMVRDAWRYEKDAR